MFIMFPCDSCPKNFSNAISLGIHRKKFHLADGYVCTSCSAKFQNRTSLFRHRKACTASTSLSGDAGVVSTVSKITNKTFSKIICGICDETILNVIDLCQHVYKNHNVPAAIQKLSFSTVDEFDQWVKRVESEGTFEFKSARSRNNKNSKVKYFHCHRSGKYESRSTGKRASKPGGSIKTGYTCSAFANVTEFANGKVEVSCCLQHYLHDSRLIHIHMPDDARATVGRYLAAGHDVDWILQEFRSK